MHIWVLLLLISVTLSCWSICTIFIRSVSSTRFPWILPILQNNPYISIWSVVRFPILESLLVSSFKVLIEHRVSGSCSLERWSFNFLLSTSWYIESSCLSSIVDLIIITVVTLNWLVTALLHFFIKISRVVLVISCVGLPLRSGLRSSSHCRSSYCSTNICLSWVFLDLWRPILKVNHLVIVASCLIYWVRRRGHSLLPNTWISWPVVVISLNQTGWPTLSTYIFITGVRVSSTCCVNHTCSCNSSTTKLLIGCWHLMQRLFSSTSICLCLVSTTAISIWLEVLLMLRSISIWSLLLLGYLTAWRSNHLLLSHFYWLCNLLLHMLLIASLLPSSIISLSSCWRILNIIAMLLILLSVSPLASLRVLPLPLFPLLYNIPLLHNSTSSGNILVIFLHSEDLVVLLVLVQTSTFSILLHFSFFLSTICIEGSFSISLFIIIIFFLVISLFSFQLFFFFLFILTSNSFYLVWLQNIPHLLLILLDSSRDAVSWILKCFFLLYITHCSYPFLSRSIFLLLLMLMPLLVVLVETSSSFFLYYIEVSLIFLIF